MFNDSLAKSLIDKKYLQIDSHVKIQGELDNYLIKKIINTSKGFMFILYTLNSSLIFKRFSRAIESIDGMDPIVFAAAYDILPNGEKKPEGKRRGRPLKVRSLEYIAAKAERERLSAERKANRLSKLRPLK